MVVGNLKSMHASHQYKTILKTYKSSKENLNSLQPIMIIKENRVQLLLEVAQVDRVLELAL